MRRWNVCEMCELGNVDEGEGDVGLCELEDGETLEVATALFGEAKVFIAFKCIGMLGKFG